MAVDIITFTFIAILAVGLALRNHLYDRLLLIKADSSVEYINNISVEDISEVLLAAKVSMEMLRQRLERLLSVEASRLVCDTVKQDKQR